MKKKLPFFLLLLLILLFQTTIFVESHDTNPALWKYMLQWPPTFCINLNSEKNVRCKEPIPEDEFTLHGLMAADEEGFNIDCGYHKDSNWDNVFGPIEDELVTFWPSLREDYSLRDLWEYEWRAHGSCGGTTPKEYFRKAIKINQLPKHGNLLNYFKASGIFPSDKHGYKKEHIVKAIQKLFDESRFRPSPPLNVYLSCVPKDNTHFYLIEVTLCTNVHGNEYISCPSKAEPTSCPHDALIMLPHPKDQELDLPRNIWKKPIERISNV